MIKRIEGITVKQEVLKGIIPSEGKTRCPICGRKKLGNQPCKSRYNVNLRMQNLINGYVRRELNLHD